MIHCARIVLILGGMTWAIPALGQLPPNPAPPAKYKATVRYHIPAPRDLHVAAYDALERHLQSLDFEFDPPLQKRPNTDREDRSKNYRRGTIPSKHALKALESPVVQSLMLVPDGFDLPGEVDAQVLVRLELVGNLPPAGQRELADQTRVLLRELGFREAIGYDHRGYSKRPHTRIVGSIARGKLDVLGRDLRNHPAGWLGPIMSRNELPKPFSEVNVVQVIEVLPDSDGISEFGDPAPRGELYLDKISPELWGFVKEKDLGSQQVRVQIGFVGRMQGDESGWKELLRETAPGFFVESQLGQFVTGIVRVDQVKRLAASPVIDVIRFPHMTHVNVDPSIVIKGDNAKAVEQTKLKELHARGYRGQGVKVGIIDRDFRGWDKLIEKKLLPAKTRLVDLTTEANPKIEPNGYPQDGVEYGHGTLCARATAIAAPDAEIVLIRIDTVDPAHLAEIVRYVSQAGRFSATLDKRDGEVLARTGELRNRRAELLEERRIILNDFKDETEQKDYRGFLGPFYTWLYSDREWHRQRMDIHDKLESDHLKKQKRLSDQLKAVNSLEGIGILVNALSWHSGYALGGNSPFSKLLNDPNGPLWFQAAGNTRGQTWIGRLRQTAGDPAIRFSADDVPIPQGRWSNEINFLNWQPYNGKPSLDLPDKVRLRLTLQWREPHDPDYFQLGDDDPYRVPLAEMRLMLLRQRDPEAKTVPADVFDLVGRTGGLPNKLEPGSPFDQPPKSRIYRAFGGPQRIEHLPTSSVYEAVLEMPLPKGGRYAVRVEKQVDSRWMFITHPERKTPLFHRVKDLVPTGIRPLGQPTLPDLEKDWDLRPRLFVEVIDDANRVKGRIVFADFWTDSASIGLPADARNVISIGAASLKNQPQPYSAFGSPPGIELMRRPSLYAYDELDLPAGGAYGTSVANAFAAGTVAAMLSAGKVSREQAMQMLREQDGQVLRVPVKEPRTK